MVVLRRRLLQDGIRGRACMAARSWLSSTPCVRESKEDCDLYGQEVLRHWRRNGGGGGMWCHKTTRLTCARGGTSLTPLQKGRRHAAAFRRIERPAITDNHPRPLGEVGGAGNSSNVRRVAVVPVGGGQVSSYCNTLLKYITYLFGGH